MSVGIGLPGVSIGINLPVYPEFVRVPGYPVYYAPGLNSNYFFYDGMYWVYEGDTWYASSWYNGPWGVVEPRYVPVFVLRIPVRYYRAPPPYFRDWRAEAPPRWGEHWGNDWQRQRKGWDQWNRHSIPAPAPLPVYQRRYSGDRYPQQIEQQQALRSQNYRFQPRDPVVRQHVREQAPPRAPAPFQRGPHQGTQARDPNPQAPAGAGVRKPAPIQEARDPNGPHGQEQKKQPHQPRVEPRAQQPSGAQRPGRPQDKAAPQERQPRDEQGRDRGRSEEQGKDRGRSDEQGREHKK